MWTQAWDPSEHKHSHFIAIPKGFSGKPPPHVLHSFIPRKTNNSDWSSKARFSNKQVPSNSFCFCVTPIPHSSLKGPSGMIWMTICVTPSIKGSKHCTQPMWASPMEVFSPSCANTVSSGLEVTDRLCGILDAKTKNRMESCTAGRGTSLECEGHYLPVTGDPLISRLRGHFCSSTPGLWFSTNKQYFTLQVSQWLNQRETFRQK